MRHIGTRRAGGFTLVEALVVAVVGLLVLVGVHRVFVAGVGSQTTTAFQTEVTSKAQGALHEMVEGGVWADTTPSDPNDREELCGGLRGARRITHGGVDRVSFEDRTGKVWRFYVSDRTLYRTDNPTGYSGGQPLCTDVERLSFAYYGFNAATGQYEQITDPAEVPTKAVRVEVTLLVARDEYPRQQASALRYATQLTTGISLRNKLVL